MMFKVGDRVKVVYLADIHGYEDPPIGHSGVVIGVDHIGYGPYQIRFDEGKWPCWSFKEENLEGEKSMSSGKKFYRVIKDHPMWDVGAILEKREDAYHPISDLWLKDIEGVDENWEEGVSLVENQPEWFERVYEVGVLGKSKYVVKEIARSLHNKDYKK